MSEKKLTNPAMPPEVLNDQLVLGLLRTTRVPCSLGYVKRTTVHFEGNGSIEESSRQSLKAKVLPAFLLEVILFS